MKALSESFRKRKTERCTQIVQTKSSCLPEYSLNIVNVSEQDIVVPFYHVDSTNFSPRTEESSSSSRRNSKSDSSTTTYSSLSSGSFASSTEQSSVSRESSISSISETRDIAKINLSCPKLTNSSNIAIAKNAINQSLVLFLKTDCPKSKNICQNNGHCLDQPGVLGFIKKTKYEFWGVSEMGHGLLTRVERGLKIKSLLVGAIRCEKRFLFSYCYDRKLYTVCETQMMNIVRNKPTEVRFMIMLANSLQNQIGINPNNSSQWKRIRDDVLNGKTDFESDEDVSVKFYI